MFICATDEHGTPAELSALEAGLPVQAYCDTMHQTQSSIYAALGISFDHFGRTSSDQNRELTQHFYERLAANGYIEERPIWQVYSIHDERFLPDRYVQGTCPKCGYDAARGDQCENCTSVLDPVDLINPRSAISGSAALEVRSSEHLFLRLDALSEELRDWVDSHAQWSRLTRSIAMKWLDEGLQERCITRDLQWGVPVPRDGFAGKVFYVWFDAPIGYIGATKEWAELAPHVRDWRDWWQNPSEVTYTQFMAKDSVPFHTIFFPAMSLGTREPWTMATQIKSFNWLTYYGGKFSTSQKRGIFLDDALELFAADYWRYYLLANSPEADDASFAWDQFRTLLNKDLVGNFGNFINRTLKLTDAQFGSVIPAGGAPSELEEQLKSDVQRTFAAYREHFAKLELRKVIQTLRELWALGNVYLDRRAPWSLVQTDRDEAALVLRTAIHLIKYFAIAAQPVIPFAAKKVFAALQLTELERQQWPHDEFDFFNFNSMQPGRPFTVPEPLFRRIEKSEIVGLERRFSGAINQ